MRDVMLDLETLGTRPGSVILSIGAVAFGPEGLGDDFYVGISLTDSVLAGLTIDASTVEWWRKQSEEARVAAFFGTRHSLAASLIGFSGWFKNFGPKTRLWGNGPRFDVGLLQAAYEAVGLEIPWEYHADRCYRTLKDCHPNVPAPDRIGVHHHALDDAKTQALHAVAMLWPEGNK